MTRRHLMGGLARDACRWEHDALKRRRPLAPGVVVIANVRAFHEGKQGAKPRPCVCVREHDLDESWALMGLTSLARYADGTARTAIVDWQAMGLHGPGFLWGGRLAIVPLEDIVDVLGNAAADDWAAIAAMCDDRRVR